MNPRVDKKSLNSIHTPTSEEGGDFLAPITYGQLMNVENPFHGFKHYQKSRFITVDTSSADGPTIIRDIDRGLLVNLTDHYGVKPDNRHRRHISAEMIDNIASEYCSDDTDQANSILNIQTALNCGIAKAIDIDARINKIAASIVDNQSEQYFDDAASLLKNERNLVLARKICYHAYLNDLSEPDAIRLYQKIHKRIIALMGEELIIDPSIKPVGKRRPNYDEATCIYELTERLDISNEQAAKIVKGYSQNAVNILSNLISVNLGVDGLQLNPNHQTIKNLYANDNGIYLEVSMYNLQVNGDPSYKLEKNNNVINIVLKLIPVNDAYGFQIQSINTNSANIRNILLGTIDRKEFIKTLSAAIKVQSKGFVNAYLQILEILGATDNTQPFMRHNLLKNECTNFLNDISDNYTDANDQASTDVVNLVSTIVRKQSISSIKALESYANQIIANTTDELSIKLKTLAFCKKAKLIFVINDLLDNKLDTEIKGKLIINSADERLVVDAREKRAVYEAEYKKAYDNNAQVPHNVEEAFRSSKVKLLNHIETQFHNVDVLLQIRELKAFTYKEDGSATALTQPISAILTAANNALKNGAASKAEITAVISETSKVLHNPTIEANAHYQQYAKTFAPSTSRLASINALKKITGGFAAMGIGGAIVLGSVGAGVATAGFGAPLVLFGVVAGLILMAAGAGLCISGIVDMPNESAIELRKNMEALDAPIKLKIDHLQSKALKRQKLKRDFEEANIRESAVVAAPDMNPGKNDASRAAEVERAVGKDARGFASAAGLYAGSASRPATPLDTTQASPEHKRLRPGASSKDE